MLRSLVGSEMCIRDRPDNVLGEIIQHALFPDTLYNNDSGGDPASIPNLCLLYTSDAADDLLCVDLGGRRIIKQKKQKEHITTTTSRVS
mgnify:CR=1 FL=1